MASVRESLVTRSLVCRSKTEWWLALVVVSLCACSAPGREGPPEAPAVEEGYFTGAGGVRLFYRKVGAAPKTVVYLHGGPWNMSDGGYEFDDLAIDRSLIAFDQRSGGRSDLVNDAAALTADHYVGDLESLRQHFGLDRMILMGQSWGAGLAVMYAVQHPSRVSRLLLLSPMAPARNPYWDERQEKTNSVIGEEGVARLAELTEAIEEAPEDEIQDLCREQIRLVFRAYLTDLSALDKMKVGYCDADPKAIRHQYLGHWRHYRLPGRLRLPVDDLESALSGVGR